MATALVTCDPAGISDSFDKPAGDYEKRMGRVTRAVARHIVSRLPPSPQSSVVCDNACGTGAVTEAIKDAFPHVKVEAIDNSQAMVSFIQRLIEHRGWRKDIRVARMDSVELQFADGVFSANIMNFGIWFTSDEQKATNEMARTLKMGGTAVVTCWKDSPLGPLFQDVQAIIKPAVPNDGLLGFNKWSDPNTLQSLFHTAGFMDIDMEEYHVVLTAPTIGELALPLAENLRVIAGTQWTGDERSRILAATETVLHEQRDKYLVVDTDEAKGVQWTPWIGTARKP